AYAVAENLARTQGSAEAVGRLRDYLNSVRERCPDCEGLLVLDARGRFVTSSGGRMSGVQFSQDRLTTLRTSDALVGDAYWDAGLGKATLALAVPIRRAGGSGSGLGVTLVLLLAGAGLVTYVGVLLVRPLERLAGAAAKVAAGDLSVELPSAGRGEVGLLTQVFKNLLMRLREREGQGELERLSVTDALTGLYNRRHLMGTLANEVQRSRRL